MKRILCVIVASIMFCVVQAQISRTIYDVTLGSEQETVKSTLNKKGISFSVQDSKFGFCLYIGRPYFAGIYWDFMLVTFDENKVSSVFFNKQRTDMVDMVALMQEAVQLLDNLSQKYSQYEDPQTGFTKKGENFESKYKLSDDLTEVLFACEFNKYDTSSMSLMYLDKRMLQNMNKKKAIDEL